MESTRVRIQELVKPAQRPVETIIVEAPRLLNARLLEVAEAAVLAFDRDTNTGGRGVSVGLPSDLQGQAASLALASAIRSGGFRCSEAGGASSPAIIASDTL